MSAILGQLRRDGRPVEKEQLIQMAEVLRHRGPYGTRIWSQSTIGLGHCSLPTTPEARYERLPQSDRTGGAVITADLRIDNRDTLMPRLGIEKSSLPVTDSDIVLAAYRKWGFNCAQNLLGDFAFAIWDAGTQTLFCARDRMGVKPFYYFVSAALFAFGSEIKALFRCPEISHKVSQERIADYLADIPPDRTATFYQNVLRLAPGEAVQVRPGGMRRWFYWCLSPSYGLHLDSDQQYAEGFQERFVEAVRCRLRSSYPVGVTLSGGLDSSAVTCAAALQLRSAEKPLPTFTLTFDATPSCDERSYVDAVARNYPLERSWVPGDLEGPLASLEDMVWHLDAPLGGHGLSMSWRMFRAARQHGVGVLLDGFDGDSTVSHGYGYLKELAAAGRWYRLWRELGGVGKLYHESQSELFWRFATHPTYGLGWLRTSTARMLWRRLKSPLRGSRLGSKQALRWPEVVSQDLARRTDLRDRYRKWFSSQPGMAGSEREEHFRNLTTGLHSAGVEALGHVSAAFGLELRHPFCDSRLVEFCLALPSEQKLSNGWSRLVMRRGLAGLLPEEIQWRPDKTEFFPQFQRGLLLFDRERIDDAVNGDTEIISDYVDLASLKRLHARVIQPGGRVSAEDCMAIWKVTTLKTWLECGAHSRAVPRRYSEVLAS